MIKLKKYRALAFIPVSVISACVLGILAYSLSRGYNIQDHFTAKTSSIRVAQQILNNEADRIRALGYDDVVKIEKKANSDVSGYSYEVVLGKEYREDLGNTVMKHKPITVNIYGSDSILPLASYSTEKVSRWYKSGSFDTSDMGIYDETGESHSGTIKRTGNGTGYVFLKKGSKLNGNVEIYDETNGDIYIYSAIGNASGDTVIRHVGPSTSSGYIRLSESSSVSGTITFENSSNGGMIIENVLKNGTSIAKKGNGTGYLMLSKGSSTNGNIQVYNDSAGAIIVNGTLYDGCVLRRTGTSDGFLTINGTVRGNVTINMDQSGKVILNGTSTSGLNIDYSSSTNKSLTLNMNKVKDNVLFLNNSYGLIDFSGTMTDGCKFLVSGTGNGNTYFSGVVEGTTNIINDTNGYISVSSSIRVHDGKTIKKIGGGTGYLALSLADLQGDFTLDADSYGYTVSEGGTDPGMNALRYPSFADGVYVYARGKCMSRTRFAWGSEVLGRVNLDYSNNPTSGWGAGSYNNAHVGNTNTVLQDGYTYKN